MNFLQVLLLPFSVLYNLATRLRNYMFDKGLRTSFKFDVPVISVGNLSVGGTGKTPAVEYILRLLSGGRRLATLSRGYGRATRGFRIAGESDTARTIGDEPYQFHVKFNEVCVAVGEDRALAIPFILAENEDTDAIILDDAFQHRTVRADLNIMLTTFGRPFFRDHILPSGRLREARSGADRADIIIVTKCPEGLSYAEMEFFRKSIAKYSSAAVYFASVEYRPLACETRRNPPHGGRMILVAGIANPADFRKFAGDNYQLCDELIFPDHHRFTKRDIENIARSARLNNAAVLTTEKDYMRLRSGGHSDILDGTDICYQPIEMKFLYNGLKFDEQVKQVFSHS